MPTPQRRQSMAVKTGTNLQVRDGRYTIDRVVFGVRLFHRFKQGTDQKSAELWVAKKTAQIINGRYLPESKQRSLTVREILNAYWNEHISGITSEYKENRKYHLDRIDAYFGLMIIPAVPPFHGEVAPGVLSAAHVERYAKKRSVDKSKQGGFVAPSTIQDEINVLVQAINFCRKRSATLRISYNPIDGYDRPKQKDPSKVVLDEGSEDGAEWWAIYSQCSENAKLLVLCLYDTGMRPKEVFFMRRSWFIEMSQERWIIEFPPEFAEKTDKERRRVPVSLRLLKEMLPILSNLTPDSLVFPSPRKGKNRTRHWSAFNTAVKRVRLMAKKASEFSDFSDFNAWAVKNKWKEEDVFTAWNVRNFTGNKVTPYALRRTRISVWDAIDENASRYASGHSMKSKQEDSHNKNYVRFPLDRLFRLVGLEYTKPSLRLVKSA